MMKKIQTVAALTACVALVFGAAPAAQARAGNAGKSNAVPKLYEPKETAAPSGSSVRFRWSASGLPGDSHRYDDLRIFRGNQAYADAMIHSAEVPPGIGAAEVPSEVLREPGVYCWTVRRVGARSKTREAFAVFTIGAA